MYFRLIDGLLLRYSIEYYDTMNCEECAREWEKSAGSWMMSFAYKS